MIRRLLRAFGLVSAGEFRVIEEKLQATRKRLEQTNGRLADAVAAADERQRARREESERYNGRLAELEAERERRAADAAEAAEQASRRITALEEQLRRRDAEMEAAVREETLLEQRVAAALQELRAAREALAIIEVKLDILEGAANVLDTRTRTGPAVR